MSLSLRHGRQLAMLVRLFNSESIPKRSTDDLEVHVYILCICAPRSLKEILVTKCEVKLLESDEVVPLSSRSGRSNPVARGILMPFLFNLIAATDIKVDNALEDIVGE